eukprot:403371998
MEQSYQEDLMTQMVNTLTPIGQQSVMRLKLNSMIKELVSHYPFRDYGTTFHENPEQFFEDINQQIQDEDDIDNQESDINPSNCSGISFSEGDGSAKKRDKELHLLLQKQFMSESNSYQKIDNQSAKVIGQSCINKSSRNQESYNPNELIQKNNRPLCTNEEDNTRESNNVQLSIIKKDYSGRGINSQNQQPLIKTKKTKLITEVYTLLDHTTQLAAVLVIQKERPIVNIQRIAMKFMSEITEQLYAQYKFKIMKIRDSGQPPSNKLETTGLKKLLKMIFDEKYDKLQMAEVKCNQVKGIMKNNVQDMLENKENMERLHEQSEQLKCQSKMFMKQAYKKKIGCCAVF